MANAVNWFELPASNFDRAVDFYSNVFGIDMHRANMMGTDMAFFPAEDKGVGGAVVFGEGYVPSDTGSIVYLNGGEDLSGALSKVEDAGGKLLLPKTAIGENGFIAHFQDTEGNRVAIHSMN
ncbi:MAG: VOC family protein [Bacteroidetes bacterium]|nr:VOC family protein [Bacteroidota bacterium]MCZ6693109.1 VOC family protein [Bacteroidota bacterium]